MLVMPLLGSIKESELNLKEKPKVANLIIKFATDILLLPYRLVRSDLININFDASYLLIDACNPYCMFMLSRHSNSLLHCTK